MIKKVVFLTMLFCILPFADSMAERLYAPTLTIKEVQQSSYVNRIVTVKGQIANKCPSSGCWFMLTDETGHIFVTSKPNTPPLTANFNVAETVEVTGRVQANNQFYQIVAESIRTLQREGKNGK